MNVRTVVTADQASPQWWEPPEPSVDIDITVWEVPVIGPPFEQGQYGAAGLATDAHGELTHVFSLDAGIPDGTDFEVRANASRGVWNWQARDTFTVSVSAGLTMVLSIDRAEYLSGDTATVVSTVSGGTPPYTWLFEVRDATADSCPGGSLLAMSVRQSNQYSYSIPMDFEGTLCFVVTSYDAWGARVVSARAFDVVFGRLQVSAQPSEYVAGDMIGVTWSLTSNVLTSPTYFYEVLDADGNLLLAGIAIASLNFQTPDPASPAYTFRVTASQAGRTATGTATVTEASGFLLRLAFDRPAYAPGGAVRAHYTLTPRVQGTPPPTTFHLLYGLVSGPTQVLSTSAGEGDAVYALPVGDEGAQLFTMMEANTGALALEVIIVDGTPPRVEPPWAVEARVGSPITVRVNASDDRGLPRVVLRWSLGGTETSINMSGDGTGTFVATLPAPAQAGAELTLLATAEDLAGNAASAETVRVVIRAEEPTEPRMPASDLGTWIALGLAAVAVAVSLVAAVLTRRPKGPPAPPSPPPEG